MVDKANVKYEIQSFDANTGSLLIKYYTDEGPDGLLTNIDVPIINGQYANQTDIEAMIELMKPTYQLERLTVSTIVEVPSFLTQHIKKE